MVVRHFSFGGSRHPLLQLLSLVVFGVLLIGAVIMGAVVLAVLLGIGVVAAIALWIRLWWLRRKLGQQQGPPGPDGLPSGPAEDGRLIEGEYVVVDKPDEQAERRPPK
jgi:hypothetical protein